MIAALAIMMPGRNRYAVPSTKRTCRATMTLVLSALELYDMENGDARIPDSTLETLIKKGYIRGQAECRAEDADTYEIVYSRGAADVRCNIHGDLSRQQGDQRDMGEGAPPKMSPGDSLNANRPLIYQSAMAILVAIIFVTIAKKS